MIAFDTETRSLRWWEGCAFLATWADGHGEEYAPLDTVEGHALLVNELNCHDVLIAHNAKFDIHMLRTTIGYDCYENGHVVHDTALMSKVVYGRSRTSHGLEELSKDLLPNGGKAATKASISDIYKELSGRTSMAHDDAFYDVWLKDPEALEAYAMADVRDTYDIFHVMWPKLQDDPRLLQLYELELALQRVLYDAERRGVRVDPEAVARLQAHHAAKEATAAAALEDQLGFLPEGEGSSELLRRRLPELGVELTELTDGPAPVLSVDRKALARFESHPAVAALFDWRRARKFQSTYLDPLVGREVVHPDVQQAEAWTGRMAYRRPNLQNIPKRTDKKESDESLRVRSVFVPRRGMEFIVADYDQIEPRILAWYLGSSEYRQVVAEGRTYEQACSAAWGTHPLGSARPDAYARGGELEHLRDVGKVIYLAIVYGAGGKAIRDQINRLAPPEFHVDVDWVKDPTNKYDTPPQANALKKRIIASIPGFEELASSNRRRPGSIMRQVQKTGYVRTLFGRKQWIASDKMYVGLNALIQGSAADVMKKAAVELARVLEPEGGYPLIFVHDEAVCEVPAGRGEELAPLVAQTMESVVDIDPPLTAEAVVAKESYAHAA